VNEADTHWQLLARCSEFNRGGAPDARNTLTPTKQDLASLDLRAAPARYESGAVGARPPGECDGASIAAVGARLAGECASLTATLILFVAALITSPATAEPWAAPGDLRLRHDLQLLNDSGVTNVPLTTWPLSWGDIDRSLAGIRTGELPPAVGDAYARVRERLRWETGDGTQLRLSAAAAGNPRIVRAFENTPREDGEVSAGVSWFGDRLALKLSTSAVMNSFDGDEVRPDGSYLGLGLGNWMLSAGWQNRWWGPGRDGSLILSHNARPMPGIAIQRNMNTPFESKWLRWIGPWSLTAFMNQLDDERIVSDALLFGLRVTFRPIDSLEIGLSRTAQWCGDDRPCDFDAFTDLLLGNDNRGVNVDPNEEPGNQLAGIDIRWVLPRGMPAALYMQWIGEDTRQGGPEIGSWLRQAGIEHWGQIAGLDHRTHVEVSDTTCREGGFGFSDSKTNCAYEHSIYRTGYRYKGRAIGYGTDGDGLTYSLGSTLVQPGGHSWNLTLRYMELNRAGAPDARHTLTATPQELADVQLTHDRLTRFGRLHVGLGVSRLDDEASGESSTDVTGFVQWVME
jgi:hypothetical protein